MDRLFRFFLLKGRKRRRLAASIAIWLLRLLRDTESSEAWRNSDLLDSFDLGRGGTVRHEYNAALEECVCCEHRLNVLDSVIEDLEHAY